MRQAQLEAPKTLSWSELPTPQPATGEAVVRIRAALTCGTDLKTYRRGHPKLKFGPFGHEASGDIVALGSGVEKFRVGDAVMWVQTAPCGRCPRCLEGRMNICEHLTDHIALGTYADYIRLPADIVRLNLFSKPAELSYIEAAFLEPFSCVVHGWNVVRRAAAAQPLPHSVAIIGAGTIGLLHLAYARHAGVAATVFAKHPQRLALARKLGAVEAAASNDAVSLPRSFPVVIDCGGTAESWRDAVRLAAPGGRVLLFSGLPEGAEVALDATHIHYDELALLGSFHFSPDDVRAARDLLIAKVVPAGDLISQVLSMDSLGDAFERLDRREAYKYALIPPPAEASWI